MSCSSETTTHEVTDLLRAWSAGRQEALAEVLPRVYDELRRLARRRLARERPDHTLEPTALVHEAFLRLVGQRSVDWRERAQFFALAAQAMRRILVDHARRRRAGHRVGAGTRVLLAALDELPAREASGPRGAGSGIANWLDLDRALDRLAHLDRRQARLVELRFYGGLTVREAAVVLEVSLPTAVRDWQMAKAWLLRELSGDDG